MGSLNRATLIAGILGMVSGFQFRERLINVAKAIEPDPNGGTGGYRSRTGMHTAAVKRMSQKRRNQQRHKAACRRSGGR